MLKAEFDGTTYVKLSISHSNGNNFIENLIKVPLLVAKNCEILPKIETNVTNFEVWDTKVELPKIEFTNIDVYQYRGIPVPKNSSKNWIFRAKFPKFSKI